MANVGDVWVEVEEISGGQRTFIKGLDPDRTWLFVLSPLDNFCWILLRDVEQGLDLDLLTIIPGPPPIDEPAISPTRPACQESLPQAECIASGGVWVAGGASAPHCECP
jgi:hypothetical protein